MIIKRWLPLFFALSLVGIGAGWYFVSQRESARQSHDLHSTSNATNPEAMYSIPKEKLSYVQERAKQGDCDSAQKLGQLYAYYDLQYDEAVRWFRYAAKCPSVYSKEMLVTLLLLQRERPGVDNEIDELLTEIGAIDPKEAKRTEEQVQFRRKEKSRQ